MTHDEMLDLIRAHVEGRPVCWTSWKTTMGDFLGREWAIEVFDVDGIEVEQELRRNLRATLDEIQKRVGRSLLLIIHTTANTDKYYAWIRHT